jgi:hypothetical protein
MCAAARFTRTGEALLRKVQARGGGGSGLKVRGSLMFDTNEISDSDLSNVTALLATIGTAGAFAQTMVRSQEALELQSLKSPVLIAETAWTA